MAIFPKHQMSIQMTVLLKHQICISFGGHSFLLRVHTHTYTCVYKHANTFTYAHTQTNAYMHTHIHIHALMHICIHTHTHAYHSCTFINIHTFTVPHISLFPLFPMISLCTSVSHLNLFRKTPVFTCFSLNKSIVKANDRYGYRTAEQGL